MNVNRPRPNGLAVPPDHGVPAHGQPTSLHGQHCYTEGVLTCGWPDQHSISRYYVAEHDEAVAVPAHDHADVEALRHESCAGCKAAAKGLPHTFAR